MQLEYLFRRSAPPLFQARDNLLPLHPNFLVLVDSPYFEMTLEIETIPICTRMSRQEMINELAKLSDAELALALSAVREHHQPETASSQQTPQKIPLREAYGLLKGSFTMSDDFDVPLDHFKDYLP